MRGRARPARRILRALTTPTPRRTHVPTPTQLPRSYVFLSQFKMAMSPAERSGVPLSQRTVHGEGADVAVSLLTATAKVLEFIREEVLDRAASMSLRAEDIGWVLTVPAIWDEAAKRFMRLAAVEAGIIADADSEQLQLALEPEGAVIASMLDASPEVRSRLGVGQRVLVLDAGGGTVDCTVSELVGADPPRLRELLPPSGGSWGGTNVDAEFRKFVNQVLLPEGARAADSHADAAASAAALDAWETAKCGWDAGEKITVSGLATVCEYVGGAEEMGRRVAAYNSARGLEGAEAVVYRPRSFSLVLPPGVVQKFFDACVMPICGHMQSLFVAAAEMGRPVGFVFLVGGFAESVYLQRQVRDALLTDDGPAATLIIPAKPVQCVNRGAAVWGLFPSSFIASRVAKCTIAVALCERYNPAVHDPVPHPSYMVHTPQGSYVDNVLVPLVQRNEDVGANEVRETEVSPVRDAQGSVLFKLFRVDRRLPPNTPDTPRVYLITSRVAEGVPAHQLSAHVPESAAIGRVNVQTGSGSALASRAKLSLYFGRTEIKAQAFSQTTGDSRQVSISWDMAAAAPELRAAT